MRRVPQLQLPGQPKPSCAAPSLFSSTSMKTNPLSPETVPAYHRVGTQGKRRCGVWMRDRCCRGEGALNRGCHGQTCLPVCFSAYRTGKLRLVPRRGCSILRSRIAKGGGRNAADPCAGEYRSVPHPWVRLRRCHSPMRRVRPARPVHASRSVRPSKPSSRSGSRRSGSIRI